MARAQMELSITTRVDRRAFLQASVIEAARQLRGESGRRQVDGARLACVHGTGGTLGVDYRFDRNWRIGGVFAYSQPDVKLAVQDAHNHIDAYQFAAYGSYASTNWFGDALAAYGRQQYALDRLGVIDTLHGSTHADVFTVAARGGYLVDFGAVRAGPIAGITYTHAVIQGYTETGDDLLTMIVDRQAIDALTAALHRQEAGVPLSARAMVAVPIMSAVARLESAILEIMIFRFPCS